MVAPLLSPLPMQRFVDVNGNAASGYKVFTYQAGTTTKFPTYTDSTGATQNTNPIILNQRGEAPVWLDPTQAYKIVLALATDTDPPTSPIWTVDNVGTPMVAQTLAGTSGAGGAAYVGFDGTTLASFFLSKNNRVVDSIAALRGLSKTLYTRAFVTGYYAAGDGGGGAYWYDPNDTNSADNGGTIIVASDGGRWKLQLTAALSAKQFGAKIDGSTDDTAAINRALATGLDVYLPKGTTVISSGLTSSSAQHLFGDGRELSVIQVNGNGYDALTLSGSYSGVRDLSFTATAARTSNAYVKFSAATRGNFVQRVKTTNAFYGIWIAANAVITTIEDVEMASTAPTNGIGIFIAGGNDTFLTRVIMDAPVASQPMCGVRIKSSQATWMTDCDMIHQGRGIQIDPDHSAGDLVTWCFFENCACDLGTSDGLIVNPQNGATVKGLFFNNCWFSSSLHGVNLLFGAGSGNAIDGVFFNNCTLFNNNNQGAVITNGANLEFNNCRVSGNSQSSSGTYAGLEFANNIVSFAVRGTRSGAIAGFANTQSWGLLLGTGCDQYVITDNNFTGNSSGAAADNSQTASGTREVRGNLSWKTIASGTASMASGTNAVTVTHGLAGTPTQVLAMPNNANIGGSSPWWAGNFSSTTFSINTAANVSANTPFAWQASLYN